MNTRWIQHLLAKPRWIQRLLAKPHWFLLLLAHGASASGASSSTAPAPRHRAQSLHASIGHLYSLDSNTYPYISSDGHTVHWHEGEAALVLATSTAVRIHKRGIMAFTQPILNWTLTNGSGWRSLPCASPMLDSLCQFPGPSYYRPGSRAFPWGTPPRVADGISLQLLHPWELRDFHCGSGLGGAGVATGNGTYNEPSLCSILDQDLDFVLYNGRLHWNDGSMLPDAVYWIICALSVYIMRCFGQLLVNPGDDGYEPDIFYPISCAVAVCLVQFYTFRSEFLTEADWCVHYFFLIYSAVYIFAWMSSYLRNKRPHNYNLVSGVLQLVASRLYVSGQTPYNAVLLFILATRVCQKVKELGQRVGTSRDRREGLIWLHRFLLLIDAIGLVIMADLAYPYSPQTLIPIFLASMCVADLIHFYKESMSARAK